MMEVNKQQCYGVKTSLTHPGGKQVIKASFEKEATYTTI